jgi:sugar phosphate isomerase/epimerase
VKLLFFCTRWGQEHLTWTDFCKKVKNAGYDGVETTLPLDDKERAQILSELNKFGLKLIAVQWDTVTADFTAHTKEYELWLRSAASANPLFITSHTGKDFFSFEQNEQLLNLAQKISDETGIKIIHETHRGKFSFAAHITKAYLEELPGLKLTLDISHWFAVAESYLANQQEAVDLALRHTDHIHARIGYVNGPQVNDPRAPEWDDVVQKHLLLWDKVLDMHKNKGSEQLTFTTEFGPFPYMQLLPYTEIPVVSQFRINEYMLNLLKRRYSLPYDFAQL